MEKYIPCKWEAKESWSSNPHIRQNRPYNKEHYKEGHSIMIRGSVQEDDNTIVNISALNIGAPEYIRQTLTDIEGEIDSNTLIVGHFNTPLTPMADQQNRKLIRKHKS